MTNPERMQLLEQLIRAHQARLRSYVLSRTGNTDVADDIVQEVFLIAFQKLDNTELNQSPFPWLLGVARNEVRSHWRAAARSTAIQELDALAAERALASDESAPQSNEPSERISGLRQCLDKLPTQDRELISRVYADGLNCEQLAQVMGKSGSAVRVALHRIRRALKQCVDLSVRRSTA